MKPIIVLPPDTISPEDIEKLRENGLCVITSKDPTAVKFLDPIASAADRPKAEQAAIELSRVLLHGIWSKYSCTSTISRADIAQMFVDIFTKGTDLGREDRRAAAEQIYQHAKASEIEKIAREEAREERAAKKAEKAAAKKG